MTRRPCHGFTLVELLVVAAIMAVFFALIVTGANPSSGSQVRQAAQSLASVLTSAQSRALGSQSGAAVIFESGTAAGLSAAACITVANGDSPPLVSGTTTTTGTLTPGTTSGSLSLVPTNADPEALLHAYKIQFGGATTSGSAVQPASDWFALACSGASGGTANCTISFRSTEGQTVLNTVWPEPIRSAAGVLPMAFRAARYPVESNVALQCGKAAAIDLRFSGIGDDPATTWGRLDAKGAIAIAFDSVGGVEALMQQVLKTGSRTADPPPIDPSEPIYLLVAPRNDVESGKSLASQQAVWVVVHPQTGRVSIAANVQQSGTDATALRAARAKARAGVVFGK